MKRIFDSFSLLRPRHDFDQHARRRMVNTWSVLATTFNQKSRMKNNFSQHIFSKGTSEGLFGHSELTHPEGFQLLKERAILESNNLVEEAISKNRNRKMVQIFDDLSDTLCQVADMAEFVRVGHPQQRFAIAAEESCLAINSTVERLNTNISLYKSLQTVVRDGDQIPTDEIDNHVAKLFIFDFEQSGIHLDQKKRERVVALNDSILRLGTYFVQNSLQGRVVPKAALPDHFLSCFRDIGDSVQIDGLYADSHDELLREVAYRIFLYPDDHQSDLLKSLLEARNELALLCGFESYAHRAVKGSLAGDPSTVNEFLEILSKELKPRAENDYNAMLKLKRKSGTKLNTLNSWDIPYYTAIAKQEKFNLRGSDYSPYFSLGACMDGLDILFQALYGISLQAEKMSAYEAWHEDVVKLGVYDKNGVLGYIYCDFIEREGKPNQDCHFTIRGGRVTQNGNYQLPIVTLVLNIPPPSGQHPSLLTPSLLDNLFHEMGHAMHSMLARTKYQHVTGTRCSTDLAEVPSILMEYFSSDPRVISKFAKHYKTGEAIPIHLLGNLSASKKFFLSSETQLQVFYAALDQALHGKLQEETLSY